LFGAIVSKKEIDRLIGDVFRHGDYQSQGSQAIRRLVEIGEPAIRAMRKAMDHPPPSDLHGRDLWDSIQAFFSEAARTLPGSVIEVLTAAPHPMILYWALGCATDQAPLDVLIEGLRDKHPITRWAAAESLVRRGDPRAVPALITALRDRSHLVKFTVVGAMGTNRMYRRPEAVPLLERIVASSSIRQHSPGLWQQAGIVLERMKKPGDR
jgi:HEAT repeat protein